MFGFDERFAMFDVTPVANQFILEYLPGAKGDYVRVYLYGLMHSYHPEEPVNLDGMSHELGLTGEEVEAAFRYWERRRLVRRVSDAPPRWQYVNLISRALSGSEEADPEYAAFSAAIYEAFDNVRRLHGSEVSACFEWKEDLGLPVEVIIMMLNHMVELKGRNFRFSDAGKLAVQMAAENVRTVEDAEDFLARDSGLYRAARDVLRKLGKRNAPSEAQAAMYRKWTREWHFTPEAIDAAIALTAKGDPSMGYLDGILRGIWEESGGQGPLTGEEVNASSRRSEQWREVLRDLGRGEVNPRSLALYEEMRKLYPQGVIRIAARECAAGRLGPEDVLKLLQAWKDKGLKTQEQVEAYVRAFHGQTALLRELRRLWGTDENRIGKTDRSLLTKWQTDWGFDDDVIRAAASQAAEARAPMAYLDKILTGYREKGVRTAEEAQKEKEKHAAAGKAAPGQPARTVLAQQYAQRDYEGVQQELMEQQNREMEAFMNGNGGGADA